jgi:hypothetical protein
MPQQHHEASPNRWDIEIEKETGQYTVFASLIIKKQQFPDLMGYQFLAGKFFVLEILNSKGLRNY